MSYEYIYYYNLILLVAFVSLALFSVSINYLERRSSLWIKKLFPCQGKSNQVDKKTLFWLQDWINMRDPWKLCPTSWTSLLITQVWSVNNFLTIAYLSYSLQHKVPSFLKTQTLIYLFLLKYSWLTILYYFQVNITVIQYWYRYTP